MPPAFTPWSRLGAAPDGVDLGVRSVVVIGAGASGLCAAKFLRDEGFSVTVLERTSEIGGAFVHKAYDGSRLVSSKYLTAFSDLRPAAADPAHLSLPQYVDYLAAYAEAEALLPLISFHTHVLAVEKRAGAGGRLKYTVRKSTRGRIGAVECDAVCVCSGLHEVPYEPNIPGLGSFSGEVLHSAQYKDSATFAGKRVLVVGCGETGMDLAYRAVQVAHSTAMSIKRGGLTLTLTPTLCLIRGGEPEPSANPQGSSRCPRRGGAARRSTR